MDISVLVTAGADVSSFVRLLESIEATTDGAYEWELVVALTPETSEDCRRLMGALEGNVTVVETGPEWLSEAVAAAQGAALAVLDGVTPEPDWLARLYEALRRRSDDAVLQPLVVDRAGRFAVHGGIVSVGGVDEIVVPDEGDPEDPWVCAVYEVDRCHPGARVWRAGTSPDGPGAVVAQARVRTTGSTLDKDGSLGVSPMVAHRRGAEGSVVVVGEIGDGHLRRLVTEAAERRLVVSWRTAEGLGPVVSDDELAARGVVRFPTSTSEPLEIQLRPAWRRRHRPRLAAVVARLHPDMVVFASVEAVRAHLDEARSFAPDASLVAVIDQGSAELAAADETWRRTSIQMLGQLDRLVVPDDGWAEVLPAIEVIGDLHLGAEVAFAPTELPPPREPHFDTSRPAAAGRTSVVIPVWNQVELTRACIDSVRQYSPADTEIIVVDNGSVDDTAQYLARQKDLTVITNEDNLGFAVASNQGMAVATGDVVVLLNNDTRVPRFWIEGLRRPFEDPDVGATGPRSDNISGPQFVPDLVYQGKSEFIGRSDEWRREHQGQTWDCDRLVGFCLAVRRSALDRVGGLDEAFGQGNFEDDDLCIRLRRDGWRLVVADEVLVHHEGSASFGQGLFGAMGRGRRIFHHKHSLSRATSDERPFLSASLIVRDEEEMLPECLLSLVGVVDEIVVCDTGSVDSTREMAEVFGARVVTAEWTNDFAAARNASLEATRGEWVLVIDADERLRGDVSSLRPFLRATPGNAMHVRFESPYGDAEGGGGGAHAAIRLFRTEDYRFQGRLHEMPMPRDGVELLVGNIMSVFLLHEGYRHQVKAERQKLLRNQRIAQAFYDSDESQPWYRSWVLARSLTRLRDQWTYAVEAADRLEADPDPRVFNEAFIAESLVVAAHAAVSLGESATGLALADRALAALPGHASARYFRGMALGRLGRFDEAEQELRGLAADGLCGHEVLIDTRLLDILVPEELRSLEALRSGDAEPELVKLSDRALAARSPEDWLEVVAAAQKVSPQGWAPAVAQWAAADPGPLLTALSRLEADATQALGLALCRTRVPTAAVAFVMIKAAAAAGRDDLVEDWCGRMLTESSEEVAAIARRLEADVPSGALRLWQQIPDSTESRMGRLRANIELGRVTDAIDSLDGIDEDALGDEDRVIVAALASTMGRPTTAVRLLRAVSGGGSVTRDMVEVVAHDLGLELAAG